MGEMVNIDLTPVLERLDAMAVETGRLIEQNAVMLEMTQLFIMAAALLAGAVIGALFGLSFVTQWKPGV